MEKKGWIRLVEVFVAILLIMGVVMIIIDKNSSGKQDLSNKAYETQVTLLHHILLNSDDKLKVLADDETEIQTRIDARKPSYLSCDVKICKVNEDCESTELPTDKDIFVQSTMVDEGNLQRIVKLFCWPS